MASIITVGGRTPTIAPEAFLADNVTIAGSVTLAARVSVWFGCVLRSENAWIAVGEDSNLQDLTVVHTDRDTPTVIGARVTVGHRALLHGCRIDDDALIGMGAIILNRAHVGAGALVAAGAVVTEDMVVPAGTLAVGVPAKIIERTLPTPPWPNVANYLELADAYRQAGPSEGCCQPAP